MTINGKEFKFVRVTIHKFKEILKHGFDNIAKEYGEAFQSEEAEKAFYKRWRFFCSEVFEKDVLWKIGRFPKALKTDNLSIHEILAIEKDFFVWRGETLNELSKQMGISIDSLKKDFDRASQSPQTLP